MSPKILISIITGVLLAIIIFLAREQIVHAWQLLGKINILILVLLIPLQAVVYFAAGEMTFSYLRAKGDIKNIKPITQARMALELNFVNHVLPSGGVSGISYMNWRLGKYGISPGKATVAQFVRYAAQFIAYIVLVMLAVIWITLDGDMNRGVILISMMIVFVMLLSVLTMIFTVSSRRRCEMFARWLTNIARTMMRVVTFGHSKKQIASGTIQKFLFDMHDEYMHLRRERNLLYKPFLWGIVFNLFDTGLFAITFWALGTPVSLAPILIAYGLASLAGVIVVTPGGTGAYEAIMVSFLASAGVPGGVAIAGTLVTRIIVLVGTIGFGYIFYQMAILRHGK